MEIIQRKKIFGFLILFFIVLNSAAQNFPSNPADITYIEYDYKQIFRHYTTNPLEAGGRIKINMRVDENSNYSLSSVYNLTVYPIICDGGIPFTGIINYTLDPLTRFIRASSSTIGDMNPLSQFSNLFLSNTFISGNYSARFWLEDLMIIRGIIFGFDFVYNGTAYVSIKGTMVECHRISLTQTFLFGEYRCGLGNGIIMNASVDYYYEKDTGLLVYTLGNYYEYVYNEPNKYQSHEVSKTLVDLKYKGQPQDNPFDFFNYEQFGDPDMVKGIVGISLIVIIAGFSILKINRVKQKKEAEAYIKMKEQDALRRLNNDSK
jgi:hypothetical protein